jgi:multicomponent Na+:H+ antiporter subunit C
MDSLLAFVIGGLYAAGIYLLLRRSLVHLIIGLSLLGNAANLLIFTVGGLTRGRPPLVPEDAQQPQPPFADPLPQALILTAIVIGFGVLAFALVLAYRAYQAVGSDDLDDMKTTDGLEPKEPDGHPSADECQGDERCAEGGAEPPSPVAAGKEATP